MATLKKYGLEVITHETVDCTYFRLTSDGFIFKNYGDGWKMLTRGVGAVRGQPYPTEKLQFVADWLFGFVKEYNKRCQEELNEQYID